MIMWVTAKAGYLHCVCFLNIYYITPVVRPDLFNRIRITEVNLLLPTIPAQDATEEEDEDDDIEVFGEGMHDYVSSPLSTFERLPFLQPSSRFVTAGRPNANTS
jgi:hypothetical protein